MSHSMHVKIPKSVYGKCGWLIPEPIHKWLNDNNLKCSFTGSDLSGDGYTNGVPNTQYHYSIQNAHENDPVMFKILFPECTVHVFEHAE